MERDAHSLREDLYRVVQHYAELADLAKKGVADPIGQIGRIIKKNAPYLLLVIRDLLPPLERNEITYSEAMYHLVREAQKFSDHQVLIDSRNEIQQIEQEGRVFLFGVKWLDAPINARPSPQDVDAILKKLTDLNQKYRERYAGGEQDTATLIPCFFPRQEFESHQTTINRVSDLVRRAVLEVHHLMMEHEPERKFIIFNSNSRKEIEQDLMNLVWFLFRCGFAVDRIASGYYKDRLADFLNEKLLDYLISSDKSIDSLQGVSSHLWAISLVDFASFFEMPVDYIDMQDLRDVARHVKVLKRKNRRGSNLMAKMVEIQKRYTAKPQGKIVLNFLMCRYHSAFGAYHGDNRPYDPRAQQAVKLYKARLDREAMERQAEEDLEKTGTGFSTKTKEEMAGLIKLIMDSLADPARVKGKKLKILGDISSGAMGKVSIGIFESRIVAVKRVKSQISSTLGDPVELLKYEAAIHARVQPKGHPQHPYIVEYFGNVEQDGEQLLVNGYYPTDNLTQLVERNWLEKYKPPFSTDSKLTLATVEIIITQILECLKHFRSAGVVHRDLKTDNILYMVDGDERLCQIKVIDFGVGVAVGSGAIEDMFRGKVVGTFSYMAPEQARGKSVFQSDLYSVGAIFTVLLTGKLPMVFPKTKTRQDLVKQIVRIEQEPRPKLTALNPLLTRNTALEFLAATVERMLDLDPMRRPNLEECRTAFDGLFQDLGEDKHTISVFYHRG